MKILTLEGKANIRKIKLRLKAYESNFVDWAYEHMLLVILASMCWTATPFMFYFADLERGYDALGGEAFVPVLPFFVWLIEKAIEDDRRN